MSQEGGKRGFTLIELLVVVLLIGILAAFAVPSYLKSVENARAEDAAGVVAMISATNRMYALDHNGTYATGTIDDTCNSGACSTTVNDACQLVRCKYLAAQNWGGKPYNFGADDSPDSDVCLTGIPAGNYSACATRKTGASPGTDTAPYNGWYYTADASGAVTGGPVATPPPTPTQ